MRAGWRRSSARARAGRRGRAEGRRARACVRAFSASVVMGGPHGDVAMNLKYSPGFGRRWESVGLVFTEQHQAYTFLLKAGYAHLLVNHSKWQLPHGKEAGAALKHSRLVCDARAHMRAHERPHTARAHSPSYAMPIGGCSARPLPGPSRADVACGPVVAPEKAAALDAHRPCVSWRSQQRMAAPSGQQLWCGGGSCGASASRPVVRSWPPCKTGGGEGRRRVG